MSNNGDFVIENGVLKKYNGEGGDVVIPEGVTVIENRAFVSCCFVETITMPKGVARIENEAFNGCLKLASIVIPNSVTYIGDLCFNACESLESITVPRSVTHIGKWAFTSCLKLKSITVEDGNTNYHSSGNCLIETQNKTLILGCRNSVIPSDGSVAAIGNSAFFECRKLKSIAIPDSVKLISEGAFAGCAELSDIYFDGSTAEWEAVKKDEGWNYFTDYNPDEGAELYRPYEETDNITVHCNDGNVLHKGRFADYIYYDGRYYDEYEFDEKFYYDENTGEICERWDEDGFDEDYEDEDYEDI